MGTGSMTEGCDGEEGTEHEPSSIEHHVNSSIRNRATHYSEI
jgi:hypothetical protein